MPFGSWVPALSSPLGTPLIITGCLLAKPPTQIRLDSIVSPGTVGTHVHAVRAFLAASYFDENQPLTFFLGRRWLSFPSHLRLQRLGAE